MATPFTEQTPRQRESKRPSKPDAPVVSHMCNKNRNDLNFCHFNHFRPSGRKRSTRLGSKRKTGPARYAGKRCRFHCGKGGPRAVEIKQRDDVKTVEIESPNPLSNPLRHCVTVPGGGGGPRFRATMYQWAKLCAQHRSTHTPLTERKLYGMTKNNRLRRKTQITKKGNVWARLGLCAAGQKRGCFWSKIYCPHVNERWRSESPQWLGSGFASLTKPKFGENQRINGVKGFSDARATRTLTAKENGTFIFSFTFVFTSLCACVSVPVKWGYRLAMYQCRTVGASGGR